MKYCAQYSNKIRLHNFDEISIRYEAEQNKYLLTFFQEHSDKRIILVVNEQNEEEFYNAQEWRKLNAIHAEYPEYNFAVCFRAACTYHDVGDRLLEIIQQLEIPYFFGDCVTNFDQLHQILKYKVSDVYLTEDICFDLKRAKLICSDHDVQVRAFPNVAQGNIKQIPALKKFFIRPEDVSVYEDCIDILEFWGPADRQEILHRIYTKGVWFGDLKDLILDFDPDLSFDSRRIIPVFAQKRKSCRRDCIAGGRCAICDRVLDLSETLKEKNLIIKTKKSD